MKGIGIALLVSMLGLTVATAAGAGPALVAQTSDPVTDHILAPIAQLGFAGAFAVACAMIWWLVRAQRDDRNQQYRDQVAVIQASTDASRSLKDAIDSFGKTIEGLATSQNRLTDQLLQRPCLESKET